MERIPYADWLLGDRLRPVAVRLECTARPLVYRARNVTEEVELYTCPHCYCIWHPNWPYPTCTDEKCWCEDQEDAWWHGEKTLVYWEDYIASHAETQEIPKTNPEG